MTAARKALARRSARGRPGFHSVTPRLVAEDAGALVDFLRAVFGATGEIQGDRPAEMRIGDSLVMVTPSGAREAFPGFLYVYVDDADATYRLAIAAGAKSVEPPLDTPYGDRRAMVRDRWGNVWQIAHVLRAPDLRRVGRKARSR
ncbi:MAG TPA: VOC family protein [Myxococcaceae bacterium]|nr:VOC family protein [Myxococcaceae bacterium]